MRPSGATNLGDPPQAEFRSLSRREACRRSTSPAANRTYADITSDELRARIDEAHRLGMKITGHLCSVGYEEAIGLGIDDLEHGPFGSPDGDLDPRRVSGKSISAAPDATRLKVVHDIIDNVSPNSLELQRLIRLMVTHHVALTFTLAVIEGGTQLPLEQMTGQRRLLHPVAWEQIVERHASEVKQDALFQARLKKEMEFERAFVRAGGMLMAGCDPTGDGHAIAGLGDQPAAG
jgi:hypothetical protein